MNSSISAAFAIFILFVFIIIILFNTAEYYFSLCVVKYLLLHCLSYSARGNVCKLVPERCKYESQQFQLLE